MTANHPAVSVATPFWPNKSEGPWLGPSRGRLLDYDLERASIHLEQFCCPLNKVSQGKVALVCGKNLDVRA